MVLRFLQAEIGRTFQSVEFGKKTEIGAMIELTNEIGGKLRLQFDDTGENVAVLSKLSETVGCSSISLDILEPNLIELAVKNDIKNIVSLT